MANDKNLLGKVENLITKDTETREITENIGLKPEFRSVQGDERLAIRQDMWQRMILSTNCHSEQARATSGARARRRTPTMFSQTMLHQGIVTKILKD